MPFALKRSSSYSVRLCASLLLPLTLIVGTASCSSDPDRETENVATAIVSEILDGSSLIIERDGQLEQISLLNVQVAPVQDKDPDVECLGDMAAELLGTLAPIGSSITLELDSALTMAEGVTAVGVRGADGHLLNAAVPEAGLGIALDGGPSAAYLTEIEASQEVARINRVGAYSSDINCTVPGQVRSALGVDIDPQATTTQTSTTASTSPPTEPAMTLGEAEELNSAAAATLAAAILLKESFDGTRRGLIWAALNGAEISSLESLISSETTRLTDAVSASDRIIETINAEAARVAEEQRLAAEAEAARVAEEQRIAAEAETARVAEEQRLAAEAEAARIAEEQRLAAEAETARIAEEQRLAAEAEAARVAEEQRLAAQAEAARRSAEAAAAAAAAANDSSSGGSGSSNDYPGYTGPRCYAPGGKTWKPC